MGRSGALSVFGAVLAERIQWPKNRIPVGADKRGEGCGNHPEQFQYIAVKAKGRFIRQLDVGKVFRLCSRKDINRKEIDCVDAFVGIQSREELAGKCEAAKLPLQGFVEKHGTAGNDQRLCAFLE